MVHLALESARIGVWEFDLASGRMVRTPELQALLGQPADLAPSTLETYLEAVHAEDRSAARVKLQEALDGRGEYADEFRIVRPDGAVRWLANRGRVLPDADRRLLRLIGASVDITERKEAEAFLVHQAFHDTLTGLPNRALLRDRLVQALASTRRATAPMAVLLLDLDRFKEINDTLGHEAGDQLLEQIGPRLRTGLRASDTLGRLGGDELAVLVPGADTEAASRVAHKLLQILEEPFLVDGQRVEVGASIGIAVYPDHAVEPDGLLRAADMAMYMAKRAGTGYVLYSTDNEVPRSNPLLLVRDLRHAIEADQLVLYVQPQFDCRRGALVGVEALVRWQHPTGGLLQPEQFIPLAERTGLIQPLSRWVLGKALQQSWTWRKHGLNIPVMVNLSHRDLRDARLSEVVAHMVARSGIPADRLQLEISERDLHSDSPQLREALARLEGIGVSIALDHFGSALVLLTLLKDLPLTTVKVNAAFVRDMASDPRGRHIVQSMIDLAHGLGLRVIGDRVEDASTWELLRRFGVDQAQGNYLGRALPAADLSASSIAPLLELGAADWAA